MKVDNFTSQLIAGKFLDEVELDLGDMQFFVFYFSEEAQRKFLCYYVIFGEMYKPGDIKSFFENFMDHTGIYCSLRWLYKMYFRYTSLKELYEKAREEADLSLLATIKSGKYAVTQLKS